MLDFVALPYSPWSEKARWAMDHHQIDYHEREYMPIFGVPMMRLKLRKLRGNITVPILFTGSDIYPDSYEIAQYADSVGRNPPLFPADARADIDRWNQLSEQILAGSRALATWRAADDPQVLEESVPRQLPKPMRQVFGRLGVRYLHRKYRLNDSDRDGYVAIIRAALTELRTALSERDHILSEFSYADITMAIALQLFNPVDHEYIRLGRATRQCMTDPELSSEFADLGEWRDRTYAAHRRRVD